MIARKVKPGVLEIIDVSSQDEIESYTLLEISDKDAYLLLASSKGFNKDGNITTINYDNGDSTDKMFKAIAQKHKESNPDNFIDVSKKYSIDDINIDGTSILLRDPKTHTIRVCYRKTTNSKEGNINRLFISNATRDRFFKCVNKTTNHERTGKYQLTSKDEDYAYWSNFMNNEYLSIIRSLRGHN